MAVLHRVSICLASRSIVEDEEIELGQPLWVGEDVEIDDLVVLDRDAEDGEHLPSGAKTIPAAPFTSAGREERARSENASASPATSRAPRNQPRRR